MIKRCLVLLLTLLPHFSLAQAPANSNTVEPVSGADVFRANCSGCHVSTDDAGPEQSAPPIESLQTMTAASLEFAINEGVMYGQASVLSNAEKAAVVEYLAAEVDDSWLAQTMCAESSRSIDLSQPVNLSSFGVDRNASRNMSSVQAGLRTEDMKDLELRWALAFPDVNALRAAPVMVGSTLFYAATGSRKVFALDAQLGCAKWVFNSPTRLRSSLSYGELGADGEKAVIFGDAEGFVYALNASTGTLIWSTDVRSHDRGIRLTGGMTLHNDKVFVPVSASGVSQGGTPTFECCVGHGELVTLDAASGNIEWVYHTMPEAEYTGELNSLGVRLRGPSGAPIWTTPTVDAARNTVYVTTGENTSHPATNTSDAIIALDIASGREKWAFQGMVHDVWNTACGRTPGPNCPNQAPSTLADKDFGGAALLIEREEGDILLAGQKTGDLWALNPDTGALLWNQRIGTGSTLGGNHWGIASDGERVFHPINDPGAARGTYVPLPGMYSFFVATGEPSWSYRVEADCSARSPRLRNCETRLGLSATPLLIDGAVVSAGVDGRLYIFDKENGELLFEHDTVRDYETVNGVPGFGGAIDSHSIAAGGGMLFIGSGYGRMGGTPGNVLLAFAPKND